jgi:hypothetical protein
MAEGEWELDGLDQAGVGECVGSGTLSLGSWAIGTRPIRQDALDRLVRDQTYTIEWRIAMMMLLMIMAIYGIMWLGYAMFCVFAVWCGVKFIKAIWEA